MTEGKIARQLIALAVPLLIGNIFQQFYNTVDAMVIGRYIGEAAFAAVGIAGTVMNLFIFLLGGCCTGISIILARLYGGGEEAAFRKESFMAFCFGTLFAIALGLGSILLLPGLLAMIQTPAELFPYVTEYLNIIFAGLVITYLYNFHAATLRAVGDTKVALLFLIVAVLLNILLDIFLISVLRLGIGGAAWATVGSQCIAAVGCGIYMRRKLPHLVFRKADRGIHRGLLRQTVRFALISALQQSSLYIGKLLVQGTVNHLGLSAISAYTATGRIEGFANSFGDSGADAISIFVAQNIGGGKPERAKEGFLKGMKFLLLLVLLLSILMFFGAKLLMALLVGEAPETILEGCGYLRVIAVFYVLCFVGSAFVGWYRGSGRVNIPFLGTTLHISIRVVLSMLLCPQFGLMGVAFATGAGWVCVVAFQVIFYFCKGKYVSGAAQKENGCGE